MNNLYLSLLLITNKGLNHLQSIMVKAKADK